ncbi:unnamed protein product [Cuscuta campestris]|uniref:Uncharacterized protein n=1 Tax=Cuscuta campestris TaxID=132261 RepID=A0A484MN86_9ASTE|nr:unnamed protein product [Cuscuta campestris]
MTPVTIVVPLSASIAITLPGGRIITISAAKNGSPATRVPAVWSAMVTAAAVLSAGEAAAVSTRQQRGATGSAQGVRFRSRREGPTGPGENSEWDPEIGGTRHGGIDIVQPIRNISEILTICGHGSGSLNGGTKLVLELHGTSMFVVVKQVMNHRLECRGSGYRGENQIRNFISNCGENPALEDGIKLEPFIIIVGERDDGAVEITRD